MRRTKTRQLVDFMAAGDWPRALSLAARFRMLGGHRTTIIRGHEAMVWPRFYASIGRDPEAAIAAAVEALRKLYPDRR